MINSIIEFDYLIPSPDKLFVHLLYVGEGPLGVLDDVPMTKAISDDLK